MLKQRISHFFILLPYLFMASGLAFIKDGDKRMVIAAVISILVSLIVYKLEPIKHNIKNKFLWVAFALAIYTGILHHIQGGSPGLIRAYFCVGLLMLCFPTQLISQRLLIGFSLFCAMTLFANSAYHAFYLGAHRSVGTINPIPYATMAASIALLSFYHLLEVPSKKVKLVSFVGLVLSLACVVLSLTRGIWLALLVGLTIILFITAWRRKVLVRYLVVSLVTLAGLFFVFENPINKRIDQTVREFNQIEKGNMNTSIGIRLQLWQASLHIMEESPWFGVGSGHRQELKKLFENGVVSKKLVAFRNHHYHNQIIDYSVKLGFVGVALLLLLYFLPIYLAFTTQSPYRSFIIGLVALYFVAGLTDVPLNHAETILMYLMLLIPLCGNPINLNTKQNEPLV